MKLLASLAAALILLALRPAFAADPSTTVDFRPLIESVLTGLAPVLVALISALAWKLIRKAGLDIDAAHRDALTQALEKAVGFGINAALTAAKNNTTLDVRSAAIAHAISYVQTATPDALKHFGLTADEIRQRILARLPAVVK